MSDPIHNFWQQYKENCSEYTRRAPLRLLGLVIAFIAAFALAILGALVNGLTGEPAAALVVIVVGAITVLVGWIVLVRMIDRPSPPAPNHPPTAMTPFGPAPGGMGQSPFAGQPAYPPQRFVAPEVVDAQLAPAWPQPAPPVKSGGGMKLVLLGIFSVLCLSCCGGAIVITRLATQLGAGGGPPAARDPFADLQRQQQEQLDDLLQQQREIWRDIERDRQRFAPGPGK
jgi:hypothetical protein